MQRVFQFFRQDLPLIAASLFLMALGIAANLLKPWPLALLVDSVFGGSPFPGPLRKWFAGLDKPELTVVLCFGVFILHAAQGVLNALQNHLAIRAGLRGLARVRNTLFSHLLGLPPAFHDSRNQGDLIYRATWDSFGFQTLFQQGVFTFLSASASLIVMVGVMWRLNHLLAVISLATIPLIAICILRFGERMKRTGALAHAADGAVSTLIQQGLAAVALVQSFTLEEREKKRFFAQSAEALAARARQHGWELMYWMVITLVFGLGTSAIAWFGSGLVIEGALTIGQLLIFLAYLAQFYEPLNQLSHLGRTISDASASTQRVFEVLDAKSPIIEGSFKLEGRARGGVEFKDVEFAYRAGTPVLSGLSFAIPPGKSLAVIGPSGAGKSTLIQLLLRFRDPASGSILLDGRDIREFQLASLRGQSAFVPQETQLLPATVAENIACGRPSASREEIEQAAESARALDFIRKLPQGFDTLVGEGLARMSVGERQRLNIARAFLRDAPLLLLDEPTSALDSETERAVVDSLERLMAGRTTIMVTHRPSTLRNVDLVLALEAGRMRFFGPRDQAFAHEGGLEKLLESAGARP